DVEHRLQLRQGQQTHSLPAEETELRILERALESSRGEKVVLPGLLQQRMAAVSEIYRRVIHHQQDRKQQQEPGAPFVLASGLESSADSSTQQILGRLSLDEPAIFQIARRKDLPPQARRNLFRFLSAAFTTSERYGAVLRSPRGFELALTLFEQSDYLTEILV